MWPNEDREAQKRVGKAHRVKGRDMTTGRAAEGLSADGAREGVWTGMECGRHVPATRVEQTDELKHASRSYVRCPIMSLSAWLSTWPLTFMHSRAAPALGKSSLAQLSTLPPSYPFPPVPSLSPLLPTPCSPTFALSLTLGCLSVCTGLPTPRATASPGAQIRGCNQR